MSGRREPLHPERLRTVEQPFAWLPCRILTNGTIASMSPTERQLYLVLALAADRRGISFYGDSRIQSIIGCTKAQLELARTALVARDLLAYDGSTYQLLALPPDSPDTSLHIPERSPRQSATAHEPAKAPVRSVAPVSPQDQRCPMPEHIRGILSDILGRRSP